MNIPVSTYSYTLIPGFWAWSVIAYLYPASYTIVDRKKVVRGHGRESHGPQHGRQTNLDNVAYYNLTNVGGSLD